MSGSNTAMKASLTLTLQDRLSAGLGALKQRLDGIRASAERIGALGAIGSGLAIGAPIVAAARLDDLRVRDDSNLPPDILLPGARQSHEVKCFALFQARRSVPHSATSFRASDGPSPWICVRSVPRMP